MIKRYSIKEIEKIFSDGNKYKIWLEIEILLLKFLQKKELIPKAELEKLISDLVVVPKQVREKEKVTNHDVVAFINHIASTTQLVEKKWIHYGLTSSDLVDTGNSVMIKQANNILLDAAHELLKRLRRVAFVHRSIYCLNRITGQKVTGATSFGYKIALLYQEVNHSIKALEKYRKNVECASISGSLGISSHIDTELQEYIAKELGLHSVECSTQVVSRDRYYVYFQLINSLLQSISRLCLELRLQARTEIGEISEDFHVHQTASSSMPHKRNPITLENICGLCRLFNAYASSMSKNIPIWFERDISHSSLDRVVFLDGFSVAIQVIRRFSKVMQTLRINVERMKKNIELNEFDVYTKYIRRTLYSKLKDFMTIEEIDEHISNFKYIAIRDKISFKEAFKKNDILDNLGEKAFNEMFDLNAQLSYIDNFYKNIFWEAEQRIRFDTIFYEEGDIVNSIENIAAQLNLKYYKSEKKVRMIAFRDESVVFLAKLLPKLNFSVEIQTIDISPLEFQIKKGEKTPLNEFDAYQDFVKKNDVIILKALLKDNIVVPLIKEKLLKLKAKEVCVVSLFSGVRDQIYKQADIFGLPMPIVDGVAGFGLGNEKGEFRNYSFVGKLKENYLY